MRVVAGIAKGRRLKSVPGLATRPTADRVRLTTFDILGDEPVAGASVVDLFAGTGALGIEALSRGAAQATFVESSHPAIEVIRANLAMTGFTQVAKVRRADVGSFLRRRSASTEFDLVFLDPPYERGLAFVARILGRLASGGWVAEGGTVVVEAAAGALEVPEGLREIRTRTFGRTQITLMVRGS